MQEDHHCAREAFVEALSWRREKQAVAHIGLGLALLGTGEEDAAGQEFGRGKGPLTLYGKELAMLLERRGRIDLARAVLSQYATGRADAPGVRPEELRGPP
jgi:hypothetical protein